MTYRGLTSIELSTLMANGCRATDWNLVRVADGFSSETIYNVVFEGDVEMAGNCRISNATLANCKIGSNVTIRSVGRFISNYNIENDVTIENISELSCDSESSFGVGVVTSPINEAGGREVMLCNELTAQTAYIMAMYRHRIKTIEKLQEIIGRSAQAARSSRGTIGRGSQIINCGVLHKIKTGEFATINGAVKLSNGTINSSQESPSHIGTGVMATDFIMTRSSRVDNCSSIVKCFVGEGVLIDRGFAADNSLFFANCECALGEACSMFAGPYTVSHHRSTLLIAGYFSFCNAGSGSNQSNHLYKTGPVHQGIHLRGCKFGSDSYVLLPALTGIFTVVTGRHYNHHDTDNLPFSYLTEESDTSFLFPGATLRSYGTSRDVNKWPRRDRRVGVSSDIIDFEMINPYTGGKILNAIKLSKQLIASHSNVDTLTWNRVKIRMSLLKKGLQAYNQALKGYISRALTAVENVDLTPKAELHKEWVDMAGMIAPKAEIDALLDALDRSEISSMSELREGLVKIHDKKADQSLEWTLWAVAELLGKSRNKLTQEDIAAIIKEGAKEQASLDSVIASDAEKDSAPIMSTGYGIDSPEERQTDFEAVRK